MARVSFIIPAHDEEDQLPRTLDAIARAAAFGDNQPMDDRDTPEAFARNRRIELRLTDR